MSPEFHDSDNGLGPDERQAITRTNDEPDTYVTIVKQ